MSRANIDLAPISVLMLRAYLEQSEAQRVPQPEDTEFSPDLVFSYPNGTPWHPDKVSKKYRRIAKAAGISLPLKNLRHSHGSILLKLGVDLRVVQERLRHVQLSTTGDFYADVLPGLL